MFSSIPSSPPPLSFKFQTKASLSTPTPTKTTLYQLLRVHKTASQLEIKTAFRTLAKLYHPDAAIHKSDDAHHFIQIHNAYETLSDPALRALYDLKLSAVGASYRRRSGGFYPSRRWETDQCW